MSTNICSCGKWTANPAGSKLVARRGFSISDLQDAVTPNLKNSNHYEKENDMRRGITSTIIFTLPENVSVSDFADARITIGQRDKALVDHPLADMEVNSTQNTLKLQLTQEETLRLDTEIPAEVQLKVKFIGGTVLATPIYRTSVRSILNEEVI
jgi:hypothetical protein